MSTPTQTQTQPQPRTTVTDVDTSEPAYRGGRAWPLVAGREIQVKLRDKNFIWSTVLSVVLLLAVLLAQSFLGGGAMSYTLGVEDAEGSAIVAEADQLAQATDEKASLTAQELGDRAAVEDAARIGDVDYGLIRTDDGWELVDEGPVSNELQVVVGDAVRTQAMAANAEAAGTDVASLMEGTTLSARDLTAQEDGTDGFMAFLLGLVFAFLFYMSSLMFGMQIAASVVEEKQSRLVEILAAAVPVRQLLVGKVLGATALAFGQLLLFVGVGLIGLAFTDYSAALAGLSEGIVWYVAFFVVGFLALACVWAAAGSLASRHEDIQSTTMPLTMVLVLVFVVGLSLQGAGRVIGSFVPVLSTILMPMRILEGETQWWEPVAALALVLVFCAITIWLGAKLYRRTVLHTSGSLTWRKALTMKD